MWSTALGIMPGITCVIGSGGKTTLLHTLGWELKHAGYSVILCTSTKIFPFSDIPFFPALTAQQLQEHSLVCTGTPLENGKITAPALSFQALAEMCDFVLVEADGSNRLPLKAHLSHEPVIPEHSRQCICVVGLSGLGRPISQAVHRPQRFAQLAGVTTADTADVSTVAAVLRAEALADRYLLNQADLNIPGQHLLQKALPGAVLGSLKNHVLFP